ncbi:MAG: type III pantothenate kinase [Planctomycetes bacterium]|nr:type III pantothenate kinase [Planctomycetota bacterium]
MWLAIDIGNTNVHPGMFEGDALLSTCSIRNESPFKIQTQLATFLNTFDLSKTRDVIISSVNPEAEACVFECIQRHNLAKPKLIGKDIPIPIAVLTDHPAKVGADRLANAVGAYERTHNWTVIVDSGTAITIDAINDKGAFLGGIIAPGMELSSRALHHYTALLPEVSAKKPGKILGTNTEEAIRTGIYWGTIGMVSTLIRLLCAEIGHQPAVIATGGSASLLAEEVPLIDAVIPQLTQEGIKGIYKTTAASTAKH